MVPRAVVLLGVLLLAADPKYKLKDGDAAFLDAGTLIYAVSGHPPGEQVAARFNGSILTFRALAPT
jgi:hypothetical protein